MTDRRPVVRWCCCGPNRHKRSLWESTQPAFADREADHVCGTWRRSSAPAMSWDDSLGNMQTLDRWRKSIGLIYESDKTALNHAQSALTTAEYPKRNGQYELLPATDPRINSLLLLRSGERLCTKPPATDGFRQYVFCDPIWCGRGWSKTMGPQPSKSRSSMLLPRLAVEPFWSPEGRFLSCPFTSPAASIYIWPRGRLSPHQRR